MYHIIFNFDHTEEINGLKDRVRKLEDKQYE